jgi:hypothetical protein
MAGGSAARERTCDLARSDHSCAEWRALLREKSGGDAPLHILISGAHGREFKLALALQALALAEDGIYVSDAGEIEIVYTALRSSSLTLAEYLRASFMADSNLRLLFDAPGTMVVSLNSPPEMVDIPADGLSVWLYHIVRDSERLNAPPKRISRSEIRRTPLPLRLHYLLTPVLTTATVNTPETEQLILGKAMQALYDHPTLLGIDLEGDFKGTALELTARLEPLGLEELSKVHGAMEKSWQLSISYEVSVVYIESSVEPEDVAPVLVPLPEYGVIVGAPRTPVGVGP